MELEMVFLLKLKQKYRKLFSMRKRGFMIVFAISYPKSLQTSKIMTDKTGALFAKGSIKTMPILHLKTINGFRLRLMNVDT